MLFVSGTGKHWQLFGQIYHFVSVQWLVFYQSHFVEFKCFLKNGIKRCLINGSMQTRSVKNTLFCSCMYYIQRCFITYSLPGNNNFVYHITYSDAHLIARKLHNFTVIDKKLVLHSNVYHASIYSQFTKEKFSHHIFFLYLILIQILMWQLEYEYFSSGVSYLTAAPLGVFGRSWDFITSRFPF